MRESQRGKGEPTSHDVSADAQTLCVTVPVHGLGPGASDSDARATRAPTRDVADTDVRLPSTVTPTGLLKWADRPWSAVISAVSLVAGISLTLFNIVSIQADMRQKRIAVAKELPRLRSFFIEIASEAFSENEDRSSEFTNCPWIDSGVLQQLKDRREVFSFIRPQLGDTDVHIMDTSLDGQISVEGGVLAMRVENNGSSPCREMTIHVEAVDLPNGGREMSYNANAFFSEGADDELHAKLFAVGDLEPGTALIVPLYVYGYLGGPIDPPRVAFGRVVIPRLIECTNLLGELQRHDVRSYFTTPLRLSAHMAGRG